MQRTVDASFEDVDAVLLVFNARERIGAGDRFVAKRVFELGVPVVIVVNKVDRLKPGHIATQMMTAAKLGDFHALHPVSAKTGDGIEELREELVALLPEGPLYFRREQRTDLPPDSQVAELVREKALHLTRDEVPHAVTVEVEEIDDKVVRANVFVETESQKQILIGKGGAMVRQIGTRARPEIEPVLGRKVFLELHVKVRPNGAATRPPPSTAGRISDRRPRSPTGMRHGIRRRGGGGDATRRLAEPRLEPHGSSPALPTA